MNVPDLSALAGSTGKPLLLIVDDQPSDVQALHELFKDDCDVYMATSGPDAIAFCQARLPDLILLDVMMPEMGGYAVCQRLKGDSLTAHVPVIFVTERSDPLEEAQGFEQGGVDFIVKPFHAAVVKARVRTHLTLKYQADRLRSLALTDGLTGVANRRHFDVTLEAEWRRCSRTDQPVSVILIDIDFFKRFNDQYGHQAGDACLQAIAVVLKASLTRSHDLVARYGGEEFVCVLPDTPFEGAEEKARQLEKAIRELGIRHDRSDVAGVVTISLGVAVANPAKGNEPDGLVACAERQLYLAKQSGRGRMRSMQMWD